MKGENVIPGAASTVEQLYELQYFVFLNSLIEPHLYSLPMVEV